MQLTSRPAQIAAPSSFGHRSAARATRRPGGQSRARRRPVVIKLGGELLEDRKQLRRIAAALTRLATNQPLVVVHGGGREVDADMARFRIQKRTVDGLRITDAPTLDVVVGVLAGRVNTRVVAAVGAAGGSAVGLTGADASIARVRRARRYRASDGSRVDLGFVGQPVGDERPTLLLDLCAKGYVPVVASIGSDARGRLFNVNADTLAGDFATRLRAKWLIIAGTTAGVLDPDGRTIPVVDKAVVERLITNGQASAGMIAKLRACQAAQRGGVTDVAIVDGRRGLLECTDCTRVIAGTANRPGTCKQ